MLTVNDREKITTCSHAASGLVAALRELVVADDLILGDVAVELLQQAASIELRVKRLEDITK